MRLRWTALAIAGLFALAPLVWAALRHVHGQEQAWSLARAAATAHERVGYEGRAAWRDACWGHEVRVVHDAESGHTRYAWGRFDHVQRGVSSRTPDPAAWCVDLAALEQSYRAREGRPARFLERPVRTLVLEPRYGGRPRVELTLDAATSLPLQVSWLKADGSLYRVAAFREVEIGPRRVEPAPGRARPGLLGRHVDPAGIDEEAGFAVLRPDYLPPGFRAVDSRVKEWAGAKVRLVYSDGATVFELAQERLLTPAQMETALVRRLGWQRAQREMQWVRWRALKAIAESGDGGADGVVVRRWRDGLHTTYELRVGDRNVTLSARADLPAEELVRVLRSLRPRS